MSFWLYFFLVYRDVIDQDPTDIINMEAKIVTLNQRSSQILMNGSIMVKYLHHCKAKVLEKHPELELKAQMSFGPSSFLNKNQEDQSRVNWSSFR